MSEIKSEILNVHKSAGRPRGKRNSKMRTIGAGLALEAMTKSCITIYVEPNPIDWRQLTNYSLFSASPDGTFLKIKSSKSAYLDCVTRQRVTDVVSGNVYRVHLA